MYVLESVGSAAALALSWLVTVTIYQLTLSIKLVFKKIKLKDVVQKRKVMNIVASSIAITWLALIILAPLYIEKQSKLPTVISGLYLGAYSILLCVYTTIICVLGQTLHRRRSFFTEEYRYIILQFMFFEAAFIIKILLQVLLALSKTQEWDFFAYDLMQAISYLLVDVLPVSFMLYSHHKTFKKELIEKKEELLFLAHHDKSTQESRVNTLEAESVL